jgi:hypothetical protein
VPHSFHVLWHIVDGQGTSTATAIAICLSRHYCCGSPPMPEDDRNSIFPGWQDTPTPTHARVTPPPPPPPQTTNHTALCQILAIPRPPVSLPPSPDDDTARTVRTPQCKIQCITRLRTRGPNRLKPQCGQCSLTSTCFWRRSPSRCRNGGHQHRPHVCTCSELSFPAASRRPAQPPLCLQVPPWATSQRTLCAFSCPLRPLPAYSVQECRYSHCLYGVKMVSVADELAGRLAQHP